MSPINLCYLWTFLLSLTNIIGVTHISWLVVLAPSIIWLILAALIIIVCTIVAVIDNNNTNNK